MAKNDKKEEPIKAKVIGLWGDPGLSEYFSFDVLSRFLIVQISPYDQVACNTDANSMIKLVLRPSHLWIRSESSGAKRVDFYGNMNSQLRDAQHIPAGGINSASYTDRNILPITPSYKIGDEIILTKLAKPLNYALGNGFRLADGNRMYEGQDIYLSRDIAPAGLTATNMSKSYCDLEGSLYPLGGYPRNLKYRGERTPDSISFVIKAIGSHPFDAYIPALIKILKSSGKFDNFMKTVGTAALSSANSCELIKQRRNVFAPELLFGSVEYLDSNLDKRERPKDSGCLPLIVANPSSFPTPARRIVGGINITLQ